MQLYYKIFKQSSFTNQLLHNGFTGLHQFLPISQHEKLIIPGNSGLGSLFYRHLKYFALDILFGKRNKLLLKGGAHPPF